LAGCIIGTRGSARRAGKPRRAAERLLRRHNHADRTHLGLAKDTPEPRAIEPPERGVLVAMPRVGGLHHRYMRIGEEGRKAA
jgi:hypothetical protein